MQKIAICAPSHRFVATMARIYNRKKIPKQQYLPHMSSQYGELRPLAAEIVSLVWASQLISTGFASWQR